MSETAKNYHCIGCNVDFTDEDKMYYDNVCVDCVNKGFVEIYPYESGGPEEGAPITEMRKTLYEDLPEKEWHKTYGEGK